MLAVRFLDPADRIRLGAVLGDVVRDAGAATAPGFIPDEEAWEHLFSADGPDYLLADVRLLRPLDPGKIIGVGFNYRDHATETGSSVPDVPMLFAKLPSALLDPEAPIVLPDGEAEPDFEAEIALVIGRHVRNAASDAEAHAAIGGYTALNDVSGRATQFGPAGITHAKGYDTFAPLGPCVAPPPTIEGWDDIRLTCTVSGELMQSSSSHHMVFGPVELVRRISRSITLLPGDVISTGTPAGVGFSRTPPRYLQPGDVVEVWVQGVGTLRNPVIAEPALSASSPG